MSDSFIHIAAAPDQTPFNIRPPYEKPPSYDESQRQMVEELGVPPPAYSPEVARRTLRNSSDPEEGTSGEQPRQPNATRQIQNHDIEGGIDNPVFNPQE